VSLVKWRHLSSRDDVLDIHRKNLAALMFHNPQRIDDLAVYLQVENTKRARINSRDVAQSTDVPQILSELHVPIDGIWGAQDAVSKERFPLLKKLLCEVDPDSEFVVVDDAGHWVQYEAAEIVNKELARLLARPRSRPTSDGMREANAGSRQETASRLSDPIA
jgi:2-hydroxy-6-oxonona-2,4-dienedioate hydrolase